MADAINLASPAALIVNVRSRRGLQQATQARRLLKAAGVALTACYGVRNPARLPAIVHTAVASGCRIIILGGGDGSVNAVVDQLAKQHLVLGLLPLGTANDFARGLGVPDDLEEACATIAQGNVATVDLGLAGENHYVNVVTMGLGAEVVKCLSAHLKRLLGPLAYPVATAIALRRYHPFAATLHFPDGDYPDVSYGRLLQIAVGNGRFYGGGAVVAPAAQVDDGMLDVYAIELRSWHTLVGVAWSLKSGQHVRRDDVPYWRTRRVQIASSPSLPVNMDGELVESDPRVVCRRAGRAARAGATRKKRADSHGGKGTHR